MSLLRQMDLDEGRPAEFAALFGNRYAEVEKVYSFKSGEYKYKPLNAAHNEIRIFALFHAQHEEDPIRGTLLHVSLDDKGQFSNHLSWFGSFLSGYNALSYTWGSVGNERKIFIDGYKFSVTYNLERALRCLRKYGSAPEYVLLQEQAPKSDNWWIDAICINQQDIAERNQQVTFMKRIYQGGYGVHVWLGDEAENSAMAMDFLQQLNGDYDNSQREPSQLVPGMTVEHKELLWRSLNALFQRPWFERVWIIQEAAFNSSITVHSGDRACRFESLAISAKIFHMLRRELRLQHSGEEPGIDKNIATRLVDISMYDYIHLRQIDSFRQKTAYPSNKFLDLITLLFHTRSCKATDGRDKIISILGLVDPKTHDLKADYGVSINGAYITAAQDIISKTGFLNILSACQNPERHHGLPSWVPNLEDEWKAEPFKIDEDVLRSSRTRADFAFEGELGSILRVKGHCLGSIKHLSHDSPSKVSSREELHNLYLSWKSFIAIAFSSSPEREYWDSFLLDPKTDRLWRELMLLGIYNRNKELPLDRNPLFTEAIQQAKALLFAEEGNEVVDSHHVKNIYDPLQSLGVGRKMCITSRDFPGLVPEDAMEGDIICELQGAVFRYVLRKVERNKYVVVGEANLCTMWEFSEKAKFMEYGVTWLIDSEYFSLI